MDVLILNGSPSGDSSITLQTVLFLKEIFSGHSYEILNVGARIRSIETDFSACTEALEKADLIVFCYPVYTFLVPKNTQPRSQPQSIFTIRPHTNSSAKTAPISDFAICAAFLRIWRISSPSAAGATPSAL